jgi:hypothetical protein
MTKSRAADKYEVLEKIGVNQKLIYSAHSGC